MNLPDYFAESMKRQYGEDRTARIFAGMAGRRKASLRVNRLKAEPADVEKALTENGIAYERMSWWEDAFLLPNTMESELWKLPIYEQGGVYLQSLSSMLPPLALEPKAGADILDMAAAPGGKTAQMASLTGNRVNITACEINKIRAEKLQYNLQKQGATRVSVMVRDARKLEDFFRFDQILLDAPCSGSGTMLESDPRTTKAFSEKLVRNSAATQLQLLKKALTLLKSGGTMVYSTCSILEMENENVVKAALKGVKAEIVPIEIPDLPLLPTSLPGALCVCPTDSYEGFFMAKIQKK